MSYKKYSDLPWFEVTAGGEKRLSQGVGPIAAARRVADELDLDGIGGFIVESAKPEVIPEIGSTIITGFNQPNH